MKKMITSLALVSVLTTSLLAKAEYAREYQLHSTIYDKSINIENASRKEVFFGTKEEYFNKVSEGLKEIQLKGLNGAISGATSQSANIAKGFLETAGKGIGTGLGIGLVIGLIDDYKKSKNKAVEYMYVVEFTTPDGKNTTGSVILSSKNEEMKKDESKDKIKEIMKGGF